MTTKQLLREKIKEKGYTQMQLQDKIGCCERTLRKYLDGTTISGRYLMELLELLDISVSNWNSCENIKGRMGKW